jgi:hypothetical protein
MLGKVRARVKAATTRRLDSRYTRRGELVQLTANVEELRHGIRRYDSDHEQAVAAVDFTAMGDLRLLAERAARDAAEAKRLATEDARAIELLSQRQILIQQMLDARK